MYLKMNLILFTPPTHSHLSKGTKQLATKGGGSYAQNLWHRAQWVQLADTGAPPARLEPIAPLAIGQAGQFGRQTPVVLVRRTT